MANPRLLQAIIERFAKGGGGNVDKPPGLSEVIPEPATKPIGITSEPNIVPKAELVPEAGFRLVHEDDKILADMIRRKNARRLEGLGQVERGPGLSERSFDEGDLAPSRVLAEVPPDIPDISSPRPQRPTTAIELRGRDARVEARELNLLSEVDEVANKVFDQIQDLDDALHLPLSSSQSDRQALRASKKLLQNFKREAAQTAAEARKTDNPTLLNAILDRLQAPLKGSQGELILQPKGK